MSKSKQKTKPQKCKAQGCKGKAPKWQKIGGSLWCWHCGEAKPKKKEAKQGRLF